MQEARSSGKRIPVDSDLVKYRSENEVNFNRKLEKHTNLTDAEIIRDYILPACRFVENGGKPQSSTSGFPLFQPTRAYNNPSQLELQFNGEEEIYLSEVATRDGTKPTQARAGFDAIQSLLALRDCGLGASILVDGFTRDFKETGHTRLIGQTVNSHADLAAIAQVYRDPRLETFGLFLIDNNGKIVKRPYLFMIFL